MIDKIKYFIATNDRSSDYRSIACLLDARYTYAVGALRGQEFRKVMCIVFYCFLRQILDSNYFKVIAHQY